MASRLGFSEFEELAKLQASEHSLTERQSIRRRDLMSKASQEQRSAVFNNNPNPRKQAAQPEAAKPPRKVSDPKGYRKPVSRQVPAEKPKANPAVREALNRVHGKPAPGYWRGKNEQQWVDGVDQAHERVGRLGKGQKRRNRWSFTEKDIDHNHGLIKQTFPQFPRNEVENASLSAKRGKTPSQIQSAIPHTAASEQLIQIGYELSGEVVEKPNSTNVHDTDLFLPNRGPEGTMVDSQDIYLKNPRQRANVSLGVLQGLDYDLDVRKAWANAPAGQTVEEFMNEIRRKSGKTSPVFDKLLHDGVRTPYRKDVLIGSVRDLPQNPHNLVLRDSQGTWTTQVGSSEYALDLRRARPQILQSTKAQLDRVAPPSGAVMKADGKMKLQLDLDKTQRALGQKGYIKENFSDDVLRSFDEIAEANNIKRGTSYHAGLSIDGKDVKRVAGDIAGNWRGGIALGALDGASREVGVRVGQGDYKGAAAEFGKTYLTGAAIEKGFRAAGSVFAKKLPGIAARVGAGSAGSGGLLTPVMATIGAVELADGLVEGVTGKDTISHVNDGMVKPYYQRRTGDTRTEEEIQSNLSGPKRVYGSDKPKPTKPQMTREAVQRASEHLSKMVPEVKPEAPTPTVKPTVTPTVKPQQKPGWQRALDQAGGWIKGKFGW